MKDFLSLQKAKDTSGKSKVVECLRTWLAEAEAGNIHAVAVIAIKSGNVVSTQSCNPIGARHALVAGCEYLKADVIAAP